MTIDERISAELRRQVPLVDERIAWDRIQTASSVRGHRAIRLVSFSTAVLGFAVLGFILLTTLSSGPDSVADLDPESPLLGTWSTADSDGSIRTMTIRAAEDGFVEIVVLEDAASVCSGTSSTMTGTGTVEGDDEIVIPSPEYTCDDGSEPEVTSGPPLEEQLRNLTFTHYPTSDYLTDSAGVVWRRPGAEDPGPDPTAAGYMWPQASLEEVQVAQELADAGNLDFTWQLEPEIEENVMWSDYLEIPEIFARFLSDELGWDDYAKLPGVGYGGSEFGGETIELTFVRCVPGESNPFYPGEPRPGGCVPTVNEILYETVTVTVAQPGLRGPSGIWVVTASELIDSVEQVIPLTDIEASAILEAFLRARIAGVGAELYLGGGNGRARLLYATSTGVAYDRSEFATIERPGWPSGSSRFEVRLFAEDGTVVEQEFLMVRDTAGNWQLDPVWEILENGIALPTLQDILGGEVIFFADDPWEGSFFGPMFETDGEPADARLEHPDGGYVYLLADPLPIGADCLEGPAPANAAALAQSILADAAFLSAAPTAVTVGDIPALQMEVTYAGVAVVCEGSGRWAMSPNLFESEAGRRVRLYLVDLPGGSARILSIAIVASADRFESVVDAAAPILASIEFHPG